MSNGLGKNQEKLKESSLEKKQGAQEKSSELHKISEQVEGKLENVDVMTMGDVAENASESKSKYQGGSGGSGAQAGQKAIAQQIKIPPVEVMRKEVAVEIEKQIHLLEKEAKRIMKNPRQFAPFTLTGVVAKIRELKEVLSQLAFATVDTLKSWWLKFVKNITI